MAKAWPDFEERAKELGYSEANILVLRGDCESLIAKYPHIWSNILSCSHNADGRSGFQYAQDLVASWLTEDSFFFELKKHGLEISRSGTDREREILAHGDVSGRSDFEIAYGGKRRYVELMNDYSRYWWENQAADLRDNKYDHIKAQNALFVGICFPMSFYFVIDFFKPVDGYYFFNRRFGGKRCFHLALTRDVFKPLDYSSLAEDLMRIVGGE